MDRATVPLVAWWGIIQWLENHDLHDDETVDKKNQEKNPKKDWLMSRCHELLLDYENPSNIKGRDCPLKTVPESCWGTDWVESTTGRTHIQHAPVHRGEHGIVTSCHMCQNKNCNCNIWPYASRGARFPFATNAEWWARNGTTVQHGWKKALLVLQLVSPPLTLRPIEGCQRNFKHSHNLFTCIPRITSITIAKIWILAEPSAMVLLHWTTSSA